MGAFNKLVRSGSCRRLLFESYTIHRVIVFTSGSPVMTSLIGVGVYMKTLHPHSQSESKATNALTC